MARLVVVTLNNASAKIFGRLRRLMLEISPGVFAGALPGRVIGEIWSAVQASSGSAVIVTSAKNEMGFRVATHGAVLRELVDNYGVQLIACRKKSSALKARPEKSKLNNELQEEVAPCVQG